MLLGWASACSWHRTLAGRRNHAKQHGGLGRSGGYGFWDWQPVVRAGGGYGGGAGEGAGIFGGLGAGERVLGIISNYYPFSQ